MRKLSFFIAMISLYSSAMFAQVGINSDNSTPSASAMLDVKSSTKGFLPPRMTTVEIDAISSPPEGLVVYNTTINTIAFYNGTSWRKSDGTNMFAIGDSYAGGIIFYIDGTGRHGLIAATSDQSTGAVWGCIGNSIPTSTAIGTGQANTIAIVDICTDEGIAARICNDLVLNGYSDWFLPSKDELNEMYLQKTAIGGFANDNYWSSSEYDDESNYAWVQPFGPGGGQGLYAKNGANYVRAVRAF
jgi:hypothetical protein